MNTRTAYYNSFTVYTQPVRMVAGERTDTERMNLLVIFVFNTAGIKFVRVRRPEFSVRNFKRENGITVILLVGCRNYLLTILLYGNGY